jgi:predicted transcriptional regulator
LFTTVDYALELLLDLDGLLCEVGLGYWVKIEVRKLTDCSVHRPFGIKYSLTFNFTEELTLMKILKIGIASLDEIKNWTLAVANGEYKITANDPKIWFSSMDSLSKVLSQENRELLSIIATIAPKSLKELALASGRHESNLSRTLHTMQQYGLVYLVSNGGKEKIPVVKYDKVQIQVNLL